MDRTTLLVNFGIAAVALLTLPLVGRAVFDHLSAENALTPMAPADPPKRAPRVREPRPRRVVPEQRPVDRAVFRHLEEVLPAGQAREEVDPGAPFRVDLYADSDGVGAKVDLDRDGAWDEIWRFSPLVRKVSPADDGANYTDVFTWDGTTWVPAP